MALRLITAAVVIFWLATMVPLVNREIVKTWVAAREAERAPTYARLETLAARPRISQMGIYLGSRRIGKTTNTLRKTDDGLLITNKTSLGLQLSGAEALTGGMGGDINLEMSSKARVVAGQLVDFDLTVRSPQSQEPLAIINGTPLDDKLLLRIKTGGETRHEQVPFDARQVFSTDLTPAFTPARMRVGERWIVRSVDPMSYTTRTAWAEVVGREEIEVGDRKVDAFLVIIPYGAQEVKVWAAPDGEVLKQKIFGFTFVREEPEAAESAHP